MSANNVVRLASQRAIEQEAISWLIRLDGDEPLSEEELQSLRDWLSMNPQAHTKAIQELAVLWDKFNVLTELSVPLVKQKTSYKWWSMARPVWPVLLMSILIIGVCLALQFGFEVKQISQHNGLYATAVGQQKATTLADDSVVLLNTNSQIKVDYGRDFRDVRLLQGEAHFTVTKDLQRPFRVYVDNSQIRAVGTAFSVYLKDEAVNVTVTEGKVAFGSVNYPGTSELQTNDLPEAADKAKKQAPSLASKEEITTLIAGQSLTINRTIDSLADNESLIKGVETVEPREMARRLSWRSGVLTFNGDSLASVVSEVSRYTTITIDIPDPDVREIKIGGRFPVGKTDAMFEVLENNFGLQVTRLTHNHVVVTSGSH